MLESESTESLYNSNYILSTIPPIGNEDIVIKHHAIDLKKAALSSNLRWIGYLSSTGVYGNRNGAWVSEEDPLRPENPVTAARVKAEENWLLLRVCLIDKYNNLKLFSLAILEFVLL